MSTASLRFIFSRGTAVRLFGMGTPPSAPALNGFGEPIRPPVPTMGVEECAEAETGD